jgi:hypothetical protein
MEEASKCPYVGASANKGMKNRDWWPNALNLKVLQQNSKLADPMGDDFDYASEFNKLDLRKTGGLLITATTVHFLFAWHGTVQVPIESLMGAAEPVRECNDSHRLTVGLTMSVWIKLVDCYGQSRKNMEEVFLGLI